MQGKDEKNAEGKPGKSSTVPLGVAYNPHKAGLSSRNLDEVNRIVGEAARGGRFYQNAERKEIELAERIKELRARVARAPASSAAADAIVTEIECQRSDLDKIFVCVDFDAFFSAVAELDDPSLVGKAHAIGGGRNSVLSTSSYKARSFGVRSAMPLFVAKKLCPHLIVVRSNHQRYAEVSQLATEKVFSKYCGDYFESKSLDECIFEISEYCAKHTQSPETVVEQLRAEVTKVTGGLTVSAGVACTRTLAKIAADFNKPNGSYFVQSSREAIVEFCQELKIRKVPGIGKVMESYLTRGFGIEKLGDILTERNRAALHFAMTERSYRFLVASALGIGSSAGEDNDASRQRKSVSRERTFTPISDASALRGMVTELCRRVAEDIVRLEGITGGRVVTLKIKTSDFRIRSRSRTVPKVVADAADLERIALEALNSELPFDGRLLGVRVHDLAGPLFDAAKVTIEPGQSRIESFFGAGSSEKDDNVCVPDDSMESCFDEDEDGIPPCPTSQRDDDQGSQASGLAPPTPTMTCPICNVSSFRNLALLNRHVDECLNEAAGLVPHLGPRPRPPDPRQAKRRKMQRPIDAYLK